jgi:hypothetical protein
MDKKTRLLEDVRAGKKNVSPRQLRRLMVFWGFSFRVAKHSVLYSHPKLKYPISVVEHREKSQEHKVLSRYVSKCIKAIDEIRELQEGGSDE